MNKRIERAFGKKIYLLGKSKDGDYIWLEEPSWDCSHYWGFGYIETYTNSKNPQNAYDISSHTHWSDAIVGKIDGEYRHHINTNPNIIETTLTDSESWTLSELMKTFYTLSDASSLFEFGSAHVTKNPINNILKDKKLYDYINKELLPTLFKHIDKLLSPKED